jgi:hypothetical protein
MASRRSFDVAVCPAQQLHDSTRPDMISHQAAGVTTLIVLSLLVIMSNGRGPAAFQHLREDKQYLTSQVKCKLWGNCLQAMEAMEQKPADAMATPFACCESHHGLLVTCCSRRGANLTDLACRGGR